MEIYRVSFIGHRVVENYFEIERAVEERIRRLIEEKEYVEFYLGRNGEFDVLVASVIKRLQKDWGRQNSCLVLVMPYQTAKDKYYEEYYDEICYPIGGETHFKSAITKRNEWLVEHTNLLIAYVKREDGGAATCLKMAEKRGIEIYRV